MTLSPPQRISQDGIYGFLHVPGSARGDGLVLTHGAGANCGAPLLVAVAEAMASAGITVLRCDLPFRQKRPHGPPPRGSAELDQEGLRQAVAYLRAQATGRVLLGGHSYGGRQASMLAAADPTVTEGLLLLSYPLHPPKRPTETRTAHFASLRIPALFVHGSRDGFGTYEELAAAVKLIPAKTEILEINGAGHELLSKSNAGELVGRIVGEVVRVLGEG